MIANFVERSVNHDAAMSGRATGDLRPRPDGTLGEFSFGSLHRERSPRICPSGPTVHRKLLRLRPGDAANTSAGRATDSNAECPRVARRVFRVRVAGNKFLGRCGLKTQRGMVSRDRSGKTQCEMSRSVRRSIFNKSIATALSVCWDRLGLKVKQRPEGVGSVVHAVAIKLLTASV